MGLAWRKAKGAQLRLLLLVVELRVLLQAGDAEGMQLPLTQALQGCGSCEQTRVGGSRAGVLCFTMRSGMVVSVMLPLLLRFLHDSVT